jgi:hypothetical protein
MRIARKYRAVKFEFLQEAHKYLFSTNNAELFALFYQNNVQFYSFDTSVVTLKFEILKMG